MRSFTRLLNVRARSAHSGSCESNSPYSFIAAPHPAEVTTIGTFPVDPGYRTRVKPFDSSGANPILGQSGITLDSYREQGEPKKKVSLLFLGEFKGEVIRV